MKRILAIIIISVLTLGIGATYAVEPTSVPPVAVGISADNLPSELSLTKALEFAELNHPSIKSKKTNIVKSQYALSEQQSAFNDLDGKNPRTYDLFLVKKGYYLASAKTGLLTAEKTLEQSIATIKFNVENAYYNYINALQKVELQKAMLTVSENNFKNINVKYTNGTASLFEVLTLSAALFKSQFDYKKAQRDLDFSLNSFNSVMSLPLDKKLTLIDKLVIAPPAEVDLKAVIQKAKENRFEIITAKEKANNDKLYMEVTSGWYEENTFKYQQSKYAAEVSAIDYTNTLNSIELSVIKAYNDMLNAYEVLAVYDKNIEVAKKRYELTKKRYDLGMATITDVITDLNLQDDLILQKSNLDLAYVLAKRQFELSYSIGLGK